MSEKLVELDEILGTLREHGPLPSDAVAGILDLHLFDARIALVDAAISGLIRLDRRGAWMLTDRGLAAITCAPPNAPTREPSRSLGSVHDERGSGGKRGAARRLPPSTHWTRPGRLLRSLRGSALATSGLFTVAALAVAAACLIGLPAEVSPGRGLVPAAAADGKTTQGRQPPSAKRPATRDRTPPGTITSQLGEGDDTRTGLSPRENAAINRLLARQPFITAGGPERPDIALTFDDGPGPYTPELLAELERLHARATFFTVGFMYRWFHAAITRELALGDVIGDHTETHPMLARLPSGAQQQQILAQAQWLGRYGGPFPRLLRPPYGSYDSATLRILMRLRMLMILWTVDTEDYLRPGVAAIERRALAGARPGAIILMHDAGGDRSQTIAALPLIVRGLRARGYTLVTVPQLILQDPPRAQQHLPSTLTGD